jgi:hypothetical protein
MLNAFLCGLMIVFSYLNSLPQSMNLKPLLCKTTSRNSVMVLFFMIQIIHFLLAELNMRKGFLNVFLRNTFSPRSKFNMKISYVECPKTIDINRN